MKLYRETFSLALAVVLIALAHSAASAPAQEIATQPAGRLQQWFEELTNQDAEVRQQARVKLMGLRRKDLPALRELVENSRPLAPSQAAALQSIVAHVYLSEEPYVKREGVGFLGVTPAHGRMEHWSEPDADFSQQQTGAVVLERLPGFVGYRMLLDGDVIVGIVERPSLRIRGPADLISSIGGHRAGETIHLKVVRGMKVIEVRVTLDTRYEDPERRDEQSIREFIRERELAAQEYWQEHFAPLLTDGMS